MSDEERARHLRELATRHGVQLEYHDARGNLQIAGTDTILAALQALGVPVSSLDDAGDALAEAERLAWARRIEPVVVAWVGSPVETGLRIPARLAGETISCRMKLEDGSRREWEVNLERIPATGGHTIGDEEYVVKPLSLPEGLPWGYHRLEVDFGDSVTETTVITTPVESFTGPRGMNRRMWGAFLPLYAVHHVEGMGFGTYSDLRTLVQWVRDLGGDMFGTLPLLATFLNEPFEPSPYSPVSRRFWNEFYIDLDSVPELDASATARAMMLAGDVQRDLEELRSNDLVDYRRAANLKRKLLGELSRTLLQEPGERLTSFGTWVERNPLALEYARFMAVVDHRREPWQEWPERLRDGVIEMGDMDEADVHYHLYVQWLADEQISAVAGEPGAGGSGLYLDLPLGVHKSGFDTWRERRAFAVDSRVGAPPDLLNEDGQDWGFPPMHPERVREDGYDYFRQCIRHHLRHAGALRIDHVMSLHRLFWIPGDATPKDGIYVSYRAEELYAILTLESHRNKALMIGEDLGTVPDEVRESMRRHEFQRMYVVPFQIGDTHEDALKPIDDGSLASLNTHDLAPFATEWGRMDARVRERIAEFLHQRGWMENVTDDPQSVLGALVRFMGDSPASMVLVNLEDLWLETEQQNVPGTTDEYPNWQRKARYDLDAFTRMPRVTDLLRELDLLRKRGR